MCLFKTKQNQAKMDAKENCSLKFDCKSKDIGYHNILQGFKKVSITVVTQK